MRYFTWKQWILLILVLFSLPNVQANPPYQQWVQDIENRLNKATELYQQNQTDDAKTEVQMAYFEVFENLEGPIRINFSAQKSYQMEASFGEIRKMMGEQKPYTEIHAKITALQQDLQEVLPALTQGHQLNASAQHDVYQHQAITPHWQQSFQIIDDRLAEAIHAYQQGKLAQAKQLVQQAQYEGYKNSEMEIAIRLHRSASQSASINQQFYDLIRLSEKPDQLNQLGYQITELLQDIEEQLPDLPDTQAAQPVQKKEATEPVEEKNWSALRDQINQQIQHAIQLYQQGENKKAMLSVQDTYFDVFESSGMENNIGSRDSQFKAELEGYFTRLVSLIKANAKLENLQQQATGLAQGLEKAVQMLQTQQQTHWSMFIYSLLIILREGLEALLIVTAIVAYLVKNQHQDKLPVIRQSVYVALVASLITAALFQLIFSNAGASRELLEGFTMIIAVVMLFMMSYWLFSKLEARQWQAYLEGKLSHALTTGSLFGLWFTSFLAVYREGAETVLFYYALIADAQSAVSYLLLFAGFIVGALLLIVCYFIMRYSVVKLPLKGFFMFTGTLLYFMAFVFAGKSVLELIEGKLFEPTFVANVPEIAWLGIYPYVETLIPQGILLLAAVFAWCYLKYQSQKATPL
ncbi:FTR1 family iron permease [Pasteurella sp. PK-2025]|uniref:FTR1 family iron permease n=1 Tax=Pasteurella sp. PK-2025 TaxID=3413133 RepID=UPI003C786D94